MYQRTLSYYIAMLYRSFADFTSDKLQEVGLNFGLLFFIVKKSKNRIIRINTGILSNMKQKIKEFYH